MRRLPPCVSVAFTCGDSRESRRRRPNKDRGARSCKGSASSEICLRSTDEPPLGPPRSRSLWPTRFVLTLSEMPSDPADAMGGQLASAAFRPASPLPPAPGGPGAVCSTAPAAPLLPEASPVGVCVSGGASKGAPVPWRGAAASLSLRAVSHSHAATSPACSKPGHAASRSRRPTSATANAAARSRREASSTHCVALQLKSARGRGGH
eukprot:scaffold4498_cov119-Isochrysis_galbana.AAC.52